jgi:hypothetical protein
MDGQREGLDRRLLAAVADRGALLVAVRAGALDVDQAVGVKLEDLPWSTTDVRGEFDGCVERRVQ